MQAAEPLTAVVQVSQPERPRTAVRSRKSRRRRRAAHRWELHTPELRYDVASLQHWLDLNG